MRMHRVMEVKLFPLLAWCNVEVGYEVYNPAAFSWRNTLRQAWVGDWMCRANVSGQALKIIPNDCTGIEHHVHGWWPFYIMLFLIFIFTYFLESSFKTSISSEYHIFYLKIAYNVESSNHLRLKTNIACSPTHFTYQKLPQLQGKINRLQGIKKKNIPSSTYHKIYERKTMSVHTPITLQFKL
jgi:hypothetical protein